MRRQLLLSTCLIAVAAVLVLGIPLGLVGSALLRDRADTRLERRADAAAIRLARADARDQPLTLALVRDLLEPGEAVRVTARGRTFVLGEQPADDTAEVSAGDGGQVAVVLVAPGGARRDDVLGVWLTVAGLGVAAMAAAAGLALLQARRLAEPLERLARRVEAVGRPDYDPAPLAGRLPEVEDVQLALTLADERIGELIRRERQFTANASHQLRTPLTGLRMRLEELQALAESPAAATETDAALAQADRLAQTIEHLEAFARRRDEHSAPLDLAALVAAHVDGGRWRERFTRAGRELDVRLPASAMADVSAEAVRQIVDVLLDNALEHGRGTGELCVEPAGGWVLVRVADDGPAPTGRRDAIFDRGAGSGAGVGLAVARELAQRGGGALRLLPEPQTTFEALLPAVVAPDTGAAGASQPTATQRL